MTIKPIARIACAVAFAGCAVNQETQPATVALDEAIARTQASALTAAIASAEADDGIGIAESVATISDDAAALLPPTKKGARRRVGTPETTCTCDTAARSCVFDGCTIGKATVSGSLSWSDGQIRCQGLTFSLGATSSDVGAASLTVDCAITYATGELSGELRATGSATVEGVDYTWDATLDATDVTFTPSAFLGGALSVSATVSSSSEEEAKTYSASAAITLP